MLGRQCRLTLQLGTKRKRTLKLTASFPAMALIGCAVGILNILPGYSKLRITFIQTQTCPFVRQTPSLFGGFPLLGRAVFSSLVCQSCLRKQGGPRIPLKYQTKLIGISISDRIELTNSYKNCTKRTA